MDAAVCVSLLLVLSVVLGLLRLLMCRRYLLWLLTSLLTIGSGFWFLWLRWRRNRLRPSLQTFVVIAISSATATVLCCCCSRWF